MADTISRHVEGQRLPRPWFTAQSYSFTLGHLLRADDGYLHRMAPLTAGERALGWLVLPPFQRPPVWTQAQQIRFMESLFSGLPCGTWIYNRPDNVRSPYDAWLLDGQQRIGAIYAYARDEYPVFGWRYSELTDRDLRWLMMGVTFAGLETKLDDEAALREVYDRLAYGGTPHEPKAAFA